ncbi:MAG TPA: heme ABC transporter ATP-binding protein [Pyrinomonadaceae bacterium]|jgi:iron complex transport system ATP-binding protein|nr:heme ABC transporter ATP-binding protein [Pyrinomonadaceae bacterium]
MLEAKDISFAVGKRDLISSVSATFESGKLHLIIGPNGAGKSTFIKVLARLLKPTTGEVAYEGQSVVATSEVALAKKRAVLSQAIEVAFPLSVREVVMMGRYPHFGGRPGPADDKVVDEMMSIVDISEFAERDYQTLSGGERQRVNFARVLAQVWPNEHASAGGFPLCRYLFLDEPLTFLDIHHQIDFMKRVRQFSQAEDAVTIGVVHDLNLAARFADRILLLNNGRLVASGLPAEVLTAELIREVFAVEPQFIPTADGVHLVFG